MNDSNMQKVLIVDDTAANLKVLNDFLSGESFNVYFASNGETALTIVKDEMPDLILLDILMPDMDGYEVCERLKSNEETAGIPVIFMTALDQLSNKIKGFKLGAVDYITKPFEIEEVSMRVKTHLVLQKMKKKLEHDLKLKSKVLSMASHEIRRPLSLITMTSQLLQLRPDTDRDQLVKYLTDINESAVRVKSMLDELLIMSRSEDKNLIYKPVHFDLRQLIDSVIHEYSITMSQFFIDLSIPETVIMTADEKLLRMVISNLVSNAIKYSPDGGTIAVSTELVEEDKVAISIEDNGIGIPEADIPLMFEEFHRAKNVEEIKGTGLGLSIVKQLVELHNGTIDIVSKVNEGTTFTITLPIDCGN